MRKRSNPSPRSFLEKLKTRSVEFACYCKQTKLCPIGGILLFLLLLLILAGCAPTVLTRCAVDKSLVEPIPLPIQPEKPTNGDLATSHHNLIAAVALDNERKFRLVKQMRECQ